MTMACGGLFSVFCGTLAVTDEVVLPFPDVMVGAGEAVLALTPSGPFPARRRKATALLPPPTHAHWPEHSNATLLVGYRLKGVGKQGWSEKKGEGRVEDWRRGEQVSVEEEWREEGKSWRVRW